MRRCRRRKSKWTPDEDNGWPLYEWYYITQAKFHHGGPTWRAGTPSSRATYVKKQNEDGSWPAPSKSEAVCARVYSTTLAALTLQVYYRFLPTYKPQVTRPEIRTNDVEIRVY